MQHVHLHVRTPCTCTCVPPEAAHFSKISDCLGCAVLLCLAVCLTLLTYFLLPSHLSLKHVYQYNVHLYMNNMIISEYRKLGSTSTGTSIRRLHICAVRIAWGTVLIIMGYFSMREI